VVATSPSISGTIVVVGTEAGTVYGIHRNEGEELWQVDVGSSVSTSACISGSVAMMGTFGGRVHGINIGDGDLEWTFPHPAEPPLDPILTTPVTNSGLVYFGADGLYCLEVRNGLKVWHHSTGDSVRGTPAIVENYLVFGCYDGLVRCLEKNLGNVVWRYSADTVFRSSVSIDYDKAFIGGRDGKLYARSILNNQAPIINAPYDLVAEAHDSILFEVSASDPEGNLLSYSWDFGDGNTSSEESPLHEYPQAGEYTVEVTVSDGTKNKKHTITVVVNPFATKTTGGDGEGLSWTVLAAGIAGAAVLVVIVVLLFLRRRGMAGHEEELKVPEEQVGEAQPVEVIVPPDEDAPMTGWEEGELQ
jgi:hypothetical protein